LGCSVRKVRLVNRDPAEFADNLHLSPAGAADFSRRLALYLAQRPALPEKAK
jgi:hypothetical protein